jgi:hypothetical protein
VVAVFLGRDARGSRMVAAALGVGLVVAGMILLQSFWGGSPQPLAGADLYRLARGLDNAQPWAAPVPALEFSSEQAGSDVLEQEALVEYELQMKQPPADLAVLNGYWWREAAQSVVASPAHSAWRALLKTFQFFGVAEFSAGPDYLRAGAEMDWLRFNLFNWGILLAISFAGLALGWRSPAAGLALALAALATAGGLLWFPTLEARAPVAVMLALLSGGMVARPWPPRQPKKITVFGLMLAGVVLAWCPRPSSSAEFLAARDSRERARALAALGDYDGAIGELTRTNRVTALTLADRDLVAGWRFSKLLRNLPVLPPAAELEQQLLDNADLAAESPAAQFRSGVCLWLLGRDEGAIYFWDNLTNANSIWGASARTALAESGRETPAQTQRRAAWDIGGGPQPDPALAPFFAKLRADQAAMNPTAR